VVSGCTSDGQQQKGISAHQLHRTLKVQYKTAWFMERRLREAMRELNPTEPLGGEGKTISCIAIAGVYSACKAIFAEQGRAM
jgi:hypothetical protein